MALIQHIYAYSTAYLSLLRFKIIHLRLMFCVRYLAGQSLLRWGVSWCKKTNSVTNNKTILHLLKDYFYITRGVCGVLHSFKYD